MDDILYLFGASETTFYYAKEYMTIYSLFLAVLRKIILLIPLIYILPLIFADKYFGVLLAEPVSDIIASTVTAIVFYKGFKEALKTLEKEKSLLQKSIWLKDWKTKSRGN